MKDFEFKGYKHNKKLPNCSSTYLWEVVKNILNRYQIADKRAIDIGCGNGNTTNLFHSLGYTVIGIDISDSGIEYAKKNFPDINFYQGSIYDDLCKKYGKFPLVLSLEVIEHCFYPRKFAKTVYDLLEPGGIAIISTPYHGYLKNLAISIFNKWDHHFSPLWDGGHIKFFSIKTLTQLLQETGYKNIHIYKAGRISLFAKSMIAVVEK